MDNIAEMKETIAQRILELEQQRDEFVQQANQQIASLNGAIKELQLLLNGATPSTPKDDESR